MARSVWSSLIARTGLWVALTLAVAAPRAAVSAIVTNGGFENYEAGWALSGNVGVGSAGVVGPNEGLVYAQFNSGDSVPNAIVSQAIATEPGAQYTLEFDYGVYGPPTGQRLRAEATGNSLLATMTAFGSADVPTNWERYSLVFVADSPTTIITFTDVSLPTTTFGVDGALDDVIVTGPVVDAPPRLLLRVEYSVPSVESGPLSLGLAALPDFFVATFALDDISTDLNVTAGLPDVSAAAIRLGDGLWTTNLTSFSFATDGAGEVTTLSYATAGITTPTAMMTPILNNSFSATIEGTDTGSSQDFEYLYSASAQTLTVQPPINVPALGPAALAVLAALIGLAAVWRIGTGSEEPSRPQR